ncbi:MAG: hypothetical protein M3R68_02470, partial [Acidobacteriota bacterium]|nr:hypothetical protein [Acidobacteriota bacterium]
MNAATNSTTSHCDFAETTVYPGNRSLFDPRIVERRQIWDISELVRVGKCLFCNSEDCHEVARREDG